MQSLHETTTVGGVMGVNFSKELLASCLTSCGRYTAYLAEKQQVHLTSAESRKHKDIVDEIDDLKASGGR